MNGPAVVLVSLFASMAAALGGIYLVERRDFLGLKGPQAVDAVVPEMHGLSETDARLSAGASHVTLFVGSHEPNAEAHPGTVLRQSVPVGHHVALDSPVVVVLADELPKVPNVVNAAIADATQRAEERGYTVYVAPGVPDAKVPLGAVVRQLPKADALYAKGGLVILEPSAGPADVELPKFVGMPINTATSQVKDLGLKPVVRWIGMAETVTNVVINQNPPAGRKVKLGSDVELTVVTP